LSAVLIFTILATGIASSNIIIDHSEDFIFDETPVKANATLTTNDKLIANGILEANNIIGANSGIASEGNIDMNGNSIHNLVKLTTASNINTLIVESSLALRNNDLTGIATILADKINVNMIEGPGIISVNETIDMKGNDIINVGNLDQEQKGGGYTKGVYNLYDKNPLPMSNGYLGEGKIKHSGGVTEPYDGYNYDCDFESRYVNLTVEYQDGTEDNVKIAGHYDGGASGGGSPCSKTISWSDPFDDRFSNNPNYPFDVKKKVSEIYTDYQGSGASAKIAYEAASDRADLSTKLMQATSPDVFTKNTTVRDITNPKDIGVLEINAKVSGQPKFPWKPNEGSYCVYTDKNENSQASAKAVLKDDNGNTEEVVSLNPQNSPRPNLRTCEKVSYESIKSAGDVGLSEISEIELIAQGDTYADSTVTASWESY
jgi:hypothetical protein